MRDKNYIRKQKLKNDSLWSRWEKRLYFSYKNEKYIVPTVFICLFFMLCEGGVIYCIFVVCVVRILCYLNNKELDFSIDIQEKRRAKREYRRKYMGEDV